MKKTVLESWQDQRQVFDGRGRVFFGSDDGPGSLEKYIEVSQISTFYCVNKRKFP